MALLIGEAPPLQPAKLIRLLDRHGVLYVVAGSWGIACHGGRVQARDLDIVPRLSQTNLERLAGLLKQLQAKPVYHPGWDKGLSPAECDAWEPDPPTEQQLDHLLATKYGLLDVVPRLCGSYEGLRRSSRLVRICGCSVRVAALNSLLRKMTRASRRKDPHRIAELLRLKKGTPGTK